VLYHHDSELRQLGRVSGAVSELETQVARRMTALEDARAVGAFERFGRRVLGMGRSLDDPVNPETVGIRDLHRRIFTQFLLDMRLQVVALALVYGTGIALARWLGESEYGTYAVITGLAIVMSYVPHLGLATTVGRWETVYLSESDRPHLKGLITRSLAITVVNSTIIMAILVAIGAALDLDLARIDVLVGLGILVFSGSLGQLTSGLLVNAQRIAASIVPTAIIVPALTIGTAATVDAISGPPSLEAAIWITVCASLVGLAIQMAFLVRSLPSELKGTHSQTLTKVWIKTGLPVLLMTFFVIVVYRGDLLFVAAIDGSSDAGVYSAALVTAEIVGLFLIAANGATTPFFAPLFKTGRKDVLQAAADSYATTVLGPAIVTAIVIIALGPWILRLYGPGFDEGYPSLVILVIAQLVKSQSGAPGYLLIMTGKGMRLAQIYSVMVVVDIVLLAILVPSIGMHGAAIATLASMLVSRIGLNIVAKRLTGIETNSLRALARTRQARRRALAGATTDPAPNGPADESKEDA
jgi:O-antigen/teichoic acid export membrane protein